ncbi:MAG: hypothetical protein MK210_07650, partial [Dehalococcoidia bacterium]|nr:hypothetical protein [Dehalococcoidia bacterium]
MPAKSALVRARSVLTHSNPTGNSGALVFPANEDATKVTSFPGCQRSAVSYQPGCLRPAPTLDGGGLSGQGWKAYM